MERKIQTAMPIQKLPMRQKTDEWKEDTIDYIIGQSRSSQSYDLPDAEEMQINYDLYNGVYREEDLKYVTDPFNQEDGFPAMAQDFNIVRQRVDLLIGEETKRPDNIFVWRTSDIASSDITEKAKQLLLNYVQAGIMAQMGPEEAMRYQEALQTGEIMAPEQIADYLTRDYKDIAETTAYHTLKYLQMKLNLKNEFVRGWKDALIAGREVYYIGVRNGEPTVERINPKNFTFEYNEGIDFIHEAGWACHEMLMSAAQAYDMLYDKMTEKQLDQLLDMASGGSRRGDWGPIKGPGDDFNSRRLQIYGKTPKDNPYGDVSNLRVYHVCWRSYKKIGFVTIPDPETGMPVDLEVDEYYKKTGNEISLEWDWILEVWEGYKIGEDLYVGIQPIDNPYITSTNINSARLPYTGAVYSSDNSKSKSLVSIMKPLQYIYIVTWYRLELAMARDKGKVINMDITQIPKSMNVDVSKWMHYLSALGVNFINPYEEGWDIPGREGGKPASFNQITALDLSMANTIGQYLEILSKIEDMVAEISGVSRQRQGAISSNELVGNVERSVVQSAHITEPLFWVHNQVKKEVLTMLLHTARAAWKNADKKYLNYVLDDTTRAFLKLSDDFAYEDYDIFVTDGTRESNVLEQVRQLIQPAMQNGASLVDALEILYTDNVNIIRGKLRDIENQRMSREQAIREQEQMMQQQLVESQNAVKEQELSLKSAELDLAKYKVDADNSTRITVAQLQAYRGTDSLDQDMNGVPDPIEIGNAAINELKVTADIANKQMELSNKQRETAAKLNLEKRKIDHQATSEKLKAEIERQKINLEKDKLKAAKELQKMSDAAAMEREKLKARTAIKNKVPGEK